MWIACCINSVLATLPVKLSSADFMSTASTIIPVPPKKAAPLLAIAASLIPLAPTPTAVKTPATPAPTGDSRRAAVTAATPRPTTAV